MHSGIPASLTGLLVHTQNVMRPSQPPTCAYTCATHTASKTDAIGVGFQCCVAATTRLIHKHSSAMYTHCQTSPNTPTLLDTHSPIVYSHVHNSVVRGSHTHGTRQLLLHSPFVSIESQHAHQHTPGLPSKHNCRSTAIAADLPRPSLPTSRPCLDINTKNPTQGTNDSTHTIMLQPNEDPTDNSPKPV